MGFWIQSGVSGFRMDAVPFIISTKGPNVRKPKEQFDMLRMFREFLQWRQGDCIVLVGSQCAARNRHGLLRRRRRSHAHDVQLSGEPKPLPCIGRCRYPPADQSVESDQAAAGDSAVGNLSAKSRRT